MGGKDINRITVQTELACPLALAWKHFTSPESVKQWNQASPDWHCPRAHNDLKVGGEFSYTMAAKDGSSSFDFKGIITELVPEQKLCFQLDDGRQVEAIFTEHNGTTRITETFEAEDIHSLDMQEIGWQATLNSFKAFVEQNTN